MALSTMRRSTPLSTRGLVLALRRRPMQSPACPSGRVPMGFAAPMTCGVAQKLHLGGQQRWCSSGNDGKDGSDIKASSQRSYHGQSEKRLDPELQGRAITYDQMCAGHAGKMMSESQLIARWENLEKAPTGEEAAVVEDGADGAIVPVVSKLAQDSGLPAFEPRMIALPLPERPLIPGQTMLLAITNKAVIKEITDAFSGDGKVYVATFLQKKEDVSSETRDVAVDARYHGGTSSHFEDISGTDPFQTFYPIGTRARVVQAVPFTSDGDQTTNYEAKEGLNVLIHGRDLVSMEKVLDLGPPAHVQVSRVELPKVPSEGPAADEVRAYINETMHTVREIMKINQQFREHAAHIHKGMEHMEQSDPHAIAHFAACLTTSTGSELMQVLGAKLPSEKLRAALSLLKKELEVSQLQQDIKTKVDEKMSSTQREFMLKEQLKMIQKELGLDKSDGTDILQDKFKTRLEGKSVPVDVKTAIDSEMEKMSGLAKESQEFQVTRNYLDWLTVLPWGVHSKDTLSVRKARVILDKDHHGLADVKQRILEQIAVGTLRGSVQGKIICFVGPPGVGKTSIGKSIAEALGREFYRFSVGGLHDVAEIKGHRRTYVGAMPGKIVQCLKKTQTENPLVLIDEIDKIGRSHNGDPSSALLELLDPSQNSAFLDHYLDVPVDASKILFVCTANVTDTIPGPLLDRMEVIRLSGYDLQEKLKIAEDYLVPNSMRELGLWHPLVPTETPPDASKPAATEEAVAPLLEMVEAVTPPSAHGAAAETSNSTESTSVVPAIGGGAPEARIEHGAVESLVRWYCREAGVRNLQKHIEKICRKLAMRVVERREAEEDVASGESTDALSSLELVVTEDGLSDLVGQPPFTSDRLYEGTLPNGTVTGLAWTAMGGSVLYLEASALPRHGGKGAPSLSVTGQLGSVMKESSQLALLVARRELATLAPESQRAFFEEHELHLHCPEGAVPKDGPSAGVTMVTALLSLGLGRPIRPDLAMTGEVSLNGKVLAIGGVKEKTMAARRTGCKVLIFPRANRKDFDELPAYLKEGLEVHFASDYSDVFAVAFPDYMKAT